MRNEQTVDQQVAKLREVEGPQDKRKVVEATSPDGTLRFVMSIPRLASSGALTRTLSAE
jgi:hypothetical protein